MRLGNDEVGGYEVGSCEIGNWLMSNELGEFGVVKAGNRLEVSEVRL